MDAQQTSNHFAGADKMIVDAAGARPLPMLNSGDAWELFDTPDLHRWFIFYKRKLGEDQAVLRDAALNHLRSTNTLNAIEQELSRRGPLASSEA